MVERLQPGRFHGHVVKSLQVADFILTESSYQAHSRLPRHAHENSYFCMVLQGGYTERCGGRKIICRPATLTFRASCETHEAQVHEANTRVFMIEIPSQWLEQLREDSLTLKSGADFYGSALTRLSARINREFHQTDSAAKLAIEGLALELLAEATRQRTVEIRSTPAWLKQARDMILARFPESLPLTQIASEVGVHPVYLATAFRQRFGVTIGELVRKLRIEQACSELTNYELSLAEVGLRAGFVDQSHFSKEFKSYVGTTPAKYRKSIRGS